MTHLVAIDYDSGKALFQASEELSVVVDINKRDIDTDAQTLSAASWLKVAPDLKYPDVWRELADAAVTSLEVDKKEAPVVERKFRVPHAVKAEVLQGQTWVKGFERGGTPVAVSVARMLSEETYLPLSKVQRIARYFARRPESITQNSGWNNGDMGFPANDRIKYALWGGNAAREWIIKINKKHPLTAGIGALPDPSETMDNPIIIAEVEQAPEVEGDADTSPDEPHEFAGDPDVPDQCMICGLFQDDELHTGLVAGAFEQNPDADYFGKGQDPDSTICTELYMLVGNDEWKMYDGTGWVDMNPPAEDAVIIMLDPASAQTLADFIENRDPESQEQGLELSMINPLEAALFAAADAEIDWDLVDRVYDIYDSQERSINAGKQVRSPGGKFGDMPDAPDSEKQTTEETKARLPQALPLVADVATRIDQYLADVAKKRGGEAPAEEPTTTPAGGDAPAEASLTAEYINSIIEKYGDTSLGKQELEAVAPEAAPAAKPEANPGGVTDVRPLYLAIVDAVDTEAVLDLVSLVPPAAGTQGDVSVWKRDAGKWVQAPDLLADLRGTSPPPVVELTDDSILTEVIAQVDKATTDGEEDPENDAPTSPEPAKPDANPDQHPVPAQSAINSLIQAMESETDAIKLKSAQYVIGKIKLGDRLTVRGYALPDGSFAIQTMADLKNSISSFETAKNKSMARRHIIKRARALNRLDLLPVTWDKNEQETGYTMWGPHGELLPLNVFAEEGGADRNRGNAEKLRHYWERGEGAAKIGWGTPDDWYRCVSHLSKYLGVRSKGYCALRHKAVTGAWPGHEKV